METKVVLPAPVGPTIAVTRPGRIFRFTLFMSVLPGSYPKLTSLNSISPRNIGASRAVFVSVTPYSMSRTSIIRSAWASDRQTRLAFLIPVRIGR